jgi:Lrp/AsnC family leucine-responsive transcriptional regulator
MAHALGSIDRNILRTLQQDARMTYVDVAERVGLSVTPCKERIRRMEREGYIQGYEARLAADKLDAGLVVFVQIRLNHTSQDLFREFSEAATALDEVQECFLVSGNYDYLLKARVADMHAYRALLGETLLQLPGVQESSTYVVMEQVKETLKIPIAY